MLKSILFIADETGKGVCCKSDKSECAFLKIDVDFKNVIKR